MSKDNLSLGCLNLEIVIKREANIQATTISKIINNHNDKGKILNRYRVIKDPITTISECTKSKRKKPKTY